MQLKGLQIMLYLNWLSKPNYSGKKTSRIVLEIYATDPSTDVEECAGSIYQRVIHTIRHKGSHVDPYRKKKLANQSTKDYEQSYQIER